MTIPPDIEAQILRYYHAEKWRIGTIARQMHVHRDTVARVLAQAGLPRIGAPPRPSEIDPYLLFIQETLAKFPTLTASRLHAMVRERGYRGGESHFRHVMARRRKHFCAWRRYPASRRRSTGDTSARWRSVERSAH